MLAVLILCSVVIAQAVVIIRRSDVGVLNGRQVEFPCETTKASSKFHWTFIPVGEPEVTIYSPDIGINEKVAGRVRVNETARSCNLVINSAQLKDAGTYVCKIISSNGAYSVVKESGELIVIDGEPVCGTNLSSPYNSVTNGDFFQLYCNVSFGGSVSSKMDCSQSRDNSNRLSEESSFNNSIGRHQQNVTFSVTYVADRLNHNTVYSCRIFFSNAHGVVGFANDNVSFYTKNWISLRINITYAPKELSISPQKQTYIPGDRLTCSSEANPTPSIEWKELNAGRIVPGNVFPIKEYMTQEPISSLECTSRNSVGMTSKTIFFSVEKEAASSEPSSSSFTSITLTIGGILSAFFLAMLTMLIIYHMHIKRIVAGRKRASNENSVDQLHSVEKYEGIQDSEGRDQPSLDGITVENPEVRVDDDLDLGGSNTMISETTYDELTPKYLTVLHATYSNLTKDRSLSSQSVGSSATEAEELDCGQSHRKHNYINVLNTNAETR